MSLTTAGLGRPGGMLVTGGIGSGAAIVAATVGFMLAADTLGPSMAPAALTGAGMTSTWWQAAAATGAATILTSMATVTTATPAMASATPTRARATIAPATSSSAHITGATAPASALVATATAAAAMTRTDSPTTTMEAS